MPGLCLPDCNLVMRILLDWRRTGLFLARGDVAGVNVIAGSQPGVRLWRNECRDRWPIVGVAGRFFRVVHPGRPKIGQAVSIFLQLMHVLYMHQLIDQGWRNPQLI